MFAATWKKVINQKNALCCTILTPCAFYTFKWKDYFDPSAVLGRPSKVMDVTIKLVGRVNFIFLETERGIEKVETSFFFDNLEDLVVLIVNFFKEKIFNYCTAEKLEFVLITY